MVANVCFCADGNNPIEKEKLTMKEREWRVATVILWARTRGQERDWLPLQMSFSRIAGEKAEYKTFYVGKLVDVIEKKMWIYLSRLLAFLKIK